MNAKNTFESFYPVIAPLLMGSGVGDGKTTMCIVAQAACIDALRRGLTLDAPTDEMECACPVLRRLAIRANDTNWWASNEERTEFLRPLIPLLLDSRGDLELTRKRMFFTVDHAVRVITPMRLEFRASLVLDEARKAKLLEGVAALRGLAEITDKASALAAREVCQEWRKAAAAAADADAAYAYAAAAAAAAAAADAAYAYAAAADADAAYAYAAAADAAYADAYAAYAYAAAADAAYAYAAAAAAAAAAADAAYAAAAADAQKRKYRDSFLEMFRAVHALGSK